MTKQLTFQVDQVQNQPDLFLIRVVAPDQAKIEVFMTMHEISGFLQSLGAQCTDIAQQCQQIIADKEHEEDSRETPRVFH